VHRSFGVVLIVVLSLGLPAPGAAAPVAIAFGESSEMTMDGLSDESAWSSATSFSLDYEISPRRVKETSWKTHGRVFHDGTSIYVWVAAEDPDPARIRALNSVRDQVFNSDSVTVVLDPGRSERRAMNFTVSAGATQADWISSSFGDGANQWDGEWESAAILDSSGYQVEFRLPFKTIGATVDAEGVLQLGINVTRQIGRDRFETLSMAPINTRETCDECQFLHAIAEQVEVLGNSWRTTPYLLATFNQTDLDDVSSTESSIDGGLDVLWSRAGTDRILMTFNPDFSQVEIDGIRLNVNQRFPTFFSERRPFFTEDSGVYSTPLFLIDTRVVLTPNIGAQYLRRSSNLGIGAFLVDDKVTTFILPGLETSRRIRLDTESINFAAHGNWQSSDRLTLGGLVTSRSASDGYANTVVSFDGNYRLGSRHDFIWHAAGSMADNPLELQNEYGLSPDQSGFAGRVAYRYSNDIYRAFFRYTQIGEDFRADLGRINQVGIGQFQHVSSLTFTGQEAAFVSRWKVSGFYLREDALEGGVLDETLTANVFISFNNDSGGGLFFEQSRESFENVEFDLSGLGFDFFFSPIDRLSIYFGASEEDAIDLANLAKGKDRGYFGGISFSVEPALELGINLSHSTFDSSQGRLFSTRSVDANVAYHFNLKHHLKAILSYSELKEAELRDGSAEYQLTYRYEPGPFTQLIAGVSGSALSEAGLGSLNPIRLFLFTKLSYTF
jgi:hypothetical protein